MVILKFYSYAAKLSIFILRVNLEFADYPGPYLKQPTWAVKSCDVSLLIKVIVSLQMHISFCLNVLVGLIALGCVEALCCSYKKTKCLCVVHWRVSAPKERDKTEDSYMECIFYVYLTKCYLKDHLVSELIIQYVSNGAARYELFLQACWDGLSQWNA